MSETDPKPIYTKPPVTEAVLALHFADPLAVRWIEKFPKKCEATYPHKENVVDFMFQVGAENAKLEQNQRGYKLTDEDHGRALFLTTEFISVSQMAPYAHWEQLAGAVKENFGVLRKLAGYTKLAKVSTRFINRIDIPWKGDVRNFKFSDYFSSDVVPSNSPLGLRVNGFDSRIILIDDSRQFTRVLAFSMGAPVLIDHLSFVLDIDVVTMTEVPSRDIDLWPYIDGLRLSKNELFEACITDATRRLFR